MIIPSHSKIIRSSSKAFIAIISILSILLSLFQPVIAVQASAPIDQNAGLEQNNISLEKSIVGAFKTIASLSLAPTGPDAPDWPPVFTKKFSPNPIYVGEISTLTFTIVNEVWMDLEGAAFTDPLPPGVQVAANPAASTTCLDAVFNPAPGDTVLSFFGTLPGRGTCTLRVNVTSSVPGEHYNITSELTTETGLTSPPATDTLIVLPRKADLAVTKTDGVDLVNAGDVTTYTVRVTNNGPATVTGATLDDSAGIGIELTAVVCSNAVGNQCVTDPLLAELTGAGISLPTLTPGQFYEILLTANITATSGTVTNTATVMPPVDVIDKNLDNNVATDTDTIKYKPKADLAVTKTDGVEQVNAGGETTYTVRVTNNGPDTVTGATLVDNAGTGLEPTAVVCSTAIDNQCVTAPLLADLISTGITLPTLAPGQFYEVLLTATITATSGTVTNTATVTPPTGTTDPNLENNTASDTDIIITIISMVDLAVTKDNGVTTVTPNSSTTYTMRVTNLGPDPVSGATLVDSAGTGLAPSAVVCSPVVGNQCVSAPVLADLISTGITLPPLAFGQFYEIRLTVTITATSGSVTNTVTVTPPAGTTDTNLGNNTASDTDTIGDIPLIDLEVTKTNNLDCVYVGDVTTYTVRVTNLGLETVSGSSLVDTPSLELTPLSAFCSPVAGNQCITPPSLNALLSSGVTLPTLAFGQFYEIKLTARVDANPGLGTNTAVVIAPPGVTEPNIDNNFASDTDVILPLGTLQADLAVTKTDGVTTVSPNSSTTYTVRVINNGPDTVNGATLVDTAGAGLAPTAVVCSATPGNQCVTAPVLANLISTGITLPGLAAGQFYEIRLTVDITAASGSVTNTAIVTVPANVFDVNLDNNQASDTNILTTSPLVDLAVTKDDGVTNVNPNSSTTYTVRVTNNGPDAVTGATLVDTVGAGLSPTAVACSATSGNQCVSNPSLANLTGAGISLPSLAAGQFYEIRLTVDITAAAGSVTNTANVTPPAGITDTNLNNNQASDTNILTTTPLVDLAITKDDGVTSVSLNSSTTYTVRVTNNGPDTVTGATLVDTVGTGLSPTAVVCSAASGNQCVSNPSLANLIATGISLPALASGQFYEIELSTTVTATSGSVTNTATISPPDGMTDSNPNDNSASDTNTLMLYKLWLPFASNLITQPVTTLEGVLGYEDLSLVTGQNDFDYNDWAVAIDGNFIYDSTSTDLLKSFSLSFKPLTRGGTYDHSFFISFPAKTFTGNGTFVVNLYDNNLTLLNRQVGTFNSNTNNTFMLFSKTSEVFPGSILNTIESNPTVPAQRFADITITFDTPVPFLVDPDVLFQPHGQNLFFDPFLLVLNISEYIHRGDVRLLSIPTNDYLWPEEGVRIDNAYPKVDYIPTNPPDFSFPASWWTVFNHCVFDGVACGTP